MGGILKVLFLWDWWWSSETALLHKVDDDDDANRISAQACFEVADFRVDAHDDDDELVPSRWLKMSDDEDDVSARNLQIYFWPISDQP